MSCTSYPVKNNEESIIVAPIDKQRGIHVFGGLDSLSLIDLADVHSDWITLVPYAGQTDHKSPNIRYTRGDDPNSQKLRDDRWKQQINYAHQAGFKVFLKPHIWIRNPNKGKWRSDIYYAEEQDWLSWQQDYRAFILHYATLAQEVQVEMFCVGTELTRLSIEKPEFWRQLIEEIREIYTGKLTYAANWYKEYDTITFWDELDYIGVQAYFPLSNQDHPSLQSINQGWQKYITKMSQLSNEFNRPLIFTEIGYKSTADAATEPWQWIDYEDDSKFIKSDSTQAFAYQAIFETVWDQSWFAGMHIWQWRGGHRDRRGRNHLDFTPQDKPAEKVIQKGFKL